MWLRRWGVSYFSDTDDFCEQHLEVILLCTSFLSTRSTLFVDVLSVKEIPRNIFLQHLHPNFLFSTHIPCLGRRVERMARKTFLLFMTKLELGTKNQEYCDVIVCYTQIGRFVEKSGLETTPINTKGYETLLSLFHHEVKNQMMENGERLHQLDGSNNHALLRSSDENTKLKIAIVGFGNFGQFLVKTIVSQGHEVSAYSRSDYSDILLELLPSDFDILCVHPIFGPQSAFEGWTSLPFIFKKLPCPASHSHRLNFDATVLNSVATSCLVAQPLSRQCQLSELHHNLLSFSTNQTTSSRSNF
ncbi:hypothetical protein Ahy_A06g029118 [Arachis hypogaea]|uniref:Pyrroline-5-carboxylate reductase catalytic N-terminal domain-containing protein n=1 Tax=Arachis hypogaea TaxID=3818 RepID=A0A445CSG0_ARAHY|nr:hypothetical protein Ahy_A06g029118 [Arachis hypogaea]